MNPPARSAPAARGANGSATSEDDRPGDDDRPAPPRREPAERRERPAGRLPGLGGEGVDMPRACYRGAADRAAAGPARPAPPSGTIRATARATRGPHVQLFTIFFQRPVEFGLATGLTVLMLAILVRSMFSSEGPTSLSRFVTRPSSRFLFAALFIGWAVVFGIGLQLVPHEGRTRRYGGIGLIAMFTGVFIMMGFIWAVIGD